MLGLPGSPDGLIPGLISPLVPPGALGDSLPGDIGVLAGVLGRLDGVEYSLVVVVSVDDFSLVDLVSLLQAASSIAALPMTANAALGPDFIRDLSFCLPGDRCTPAANCQYPLKPT